MRWSMEADVEVRLAHFPKVAAMELAKHYAVDFDKTDTGAESQGVVVRATMGSKTELALEEAVRTFLQGLSMQADAVRRAQGVLRIGVFYDLQETVVFPFRLSANVVKQIAELSLSIDATGYPCADESE
jgi:hypothetical protein